MRARCMLGTLMVWVGSVQAQTTCVYVGPDGGMWSNANHWDPEVVPANGTDETFVVVIPAGSIVFFDLGAHTEIDELVSESGSRLRLLNGSLDVLGTADVRDSILEADGETVHLGIDDPLTMGDGARVRVEDGASVRFGVVDYKMDDGDLAGRVFTAFDAGSHLNASSMLTLDLSEACIFGSSEQYEILASQDSFIDLSGLHTIIGACGDDRLQFGAFSGAAIDLSSLTEIRINESVGTGIEIDGGQIDLSSLVSAGGVWFRVAAFNTLSVPSLEEAQSCVFSLSPGAILRAPRLLDISDSELSLTAGVVLNAPVPTEADNARIEVSQGSSYAIADEEYRWSNEWMPREAVFRAEDRDSTLDFSSLRRIELEDGYESGYATIFVKDLGQIDLGGLETISSVPGRILQLNVSRSATATCGALVQEGLGGFRLAITSNAAVDVRGDVQLGLDGGESDLFISAELHVGGDFVHHITAEDEHFATEGRLIMSGAGRRFFEVAGRDLGVPQGTLPANFQWGEFGVGGAEPSTVVLMDTVDNGNRGINGEPESLYLVDRSGGAEALTITEDSVLVLNDLETYVWRDGAWLHLNTLFSGGENRVPYGQGYLQLSFCEPDWNSDGEVNTLDFLAFLESWVANDRSADLNRDGEVDTRDFIRFLSLWSAGC